MRIEGDKSLIVWRVMALSESSEPKVGTSMTTLGVRVRDLHPRLSGLVDPLEGGVSVTPEGHEHLPRAALLQLNRGKGTLFALDTDTLPKELVYRPDPDDDHHGFIEPASPTKFESYQRAVQGTSDLWQPV